MLQVVEHVEEEAVVRGQVEQKIVVEGRSMKFVGKKDKGHHVSL